MSDGLPCSVVGPLPETIVWGCADGLSERLAGWPDGGRRAPCHATSLAPSLSCAFVLNGFTTRRPAQFAYFIIYCTKAMDAFYALCTYGVCILCELYREVGRVGTNFRPLETRDSTVWASFRCSESFRVKWGESGLVGRLGTKFRPLETRDSSVWASFRCSGSFRVKWGESGLAGRVGTKFITLKTETRLYGQVREFSMLL